VAFFKDGDEVYAHIGRLLRDLIEDPELDAEFRRANTVVQYVLHDPEAVITAKILADDQSAIEFGATDLEPEVIMEMDSDTAHRFWLGRVNVTVALARGQIRAHGPVAKILKLVPIAKPVFPRYRAQLEAGGREDLLEPALAGS
jgi:hypothetical protein